MKIWKFVIGILLFIAPIGLYATSATTILYAPLGTLYTDSGGTSFAVHTFSWYSENGRDGYFFNADTPAEMWSAFYFMEFVLFVPVGLSIAGILTIITLYAVAFYILCSIIDNEVLNLLADIIMIGCAVMSFIAFFNFLNNWSGVFDTNVPIFGIIAAVVGLLGFAFSIREMMQPVKKSRKKR